MRFADGWDEYLIAELGRCPSAKALLTTYPPAYSRAGPDADSALDERPVLLCASSVGSFSDAPQQQQEQQAQWCALRQRGRLLARVQDTPVPSLFWAAGFRYVLDLRTEVGVLTTVIAPSR